MSFSKTRSCGARTSPRPTSSWRPATPNSASSPSPNWPAARAARAGSCPKPSTPPSPRTPCCSIAARTTNRRAPLSPSCAAPRRGRSRKNTATARAIEASAPASCCKGECANHPSRRALARAPQDEGKQYFSLTSATDITDKHLQEFVISMCQNAVTDAESQVTAQNEPIKERNNMHILDLSQKV